MGAHPPRIPPTGFLGLGGTPTCAGASSWSTALDDSSRFFVVRVACRAIKVQLRVAVEAITRDSVGHSLGYLGFSTLFFTLVIISQHVQVACDWNILPWSQAWKCHQNVRLLQRAQAIRIRSRNSQKLDLLSCKNRVLRVNPPSRMPPMVSILLSCSALKYG